MIVNQQTAAQKKVDELYATLGRRRGASPFGSCPVNLTASFVQLCLAQSCGKCVPCRVGLDRLHALLEKILDGRGTTDDLRAVRRSAAAIYDSADCAIGFEAARLVLDGWRPSGTIICPTSKTGSAPRRSTPCRAWPAAGECGRAGLHRSHPRGALCRRRAAHPQGQPVPRCLRSHLRASVRKALPPSDRGRFHQHPRAEALRGRARGIVPTPAVARRSTAKRSPSSAADRRALRRRTISPQGLSRHGV